jgi:hypothetical protein
MTTTAGYASSADWGVHFGLGKVTLLKRVEIQWPSGVKQILSDVKADQILTVAEPK